MNWRVYFKYSTSFDDLSQFWNTYERVLTIVMLKQISELIFYQQGKVIFKFSFTVKNNRHIDKKNI